MVLPAIGQIPDPSQLTLTTRLNGTVMQEARTDDFIFPVARLVEVEISKIGVLRNEVVDEHGSGYDGTAPRVERPA